MMKEDEDNPVQSATHQPLPLPVTEGIPSGVTRVGFLALLLMVPAAILLFGGRGLPGVGGVVLGGAVALSNLWILSRIVVVSTTTERVSTGDLVFRLLGKLAVLGLLLALVVFGLGVDVVGLLVGLTLVFLAVPLNLLADWIAGAR